MAKLFYEKNYPQFAERICNRHVMYNASIKRLEELEQSGQALVLRPSVDVKISKIEKNPEKLQELYEVGLRDANAKLAQIQAW